MKNNQAGTDKEIEQLQNVAQEAADKLKILADVAVVSSVEKLTRAAEALKKEAATAADKLKNTADKELGTAAEKLTRAAEFVEREAQTTTNKLKTTALEVVETFGVPENEKLKEVAFEAAEELKRLASIGAGKFNASENAKLNAIALEAAEELKKIASIVAIKLNATENEKFKGIALEAEEELKTIASMVAEKLHISAEKIASLKVIMDQALLAKLEAETLNRSKSAFLANISHELRTPLNGVLGFTQLLEMDNPSPKHREYLNYISQSGKNLLSLINDILDLAKIEAEKIKLENNVFNIKSIIEEIISIQELKSKEKNISLIATISSDLNNSYLGDSFRLKQILNNLVGNAIKFTKIGGVSISVNVISKKSNLDVVQFSITDTGIGMNQETLKIIFKPFVQADNSITREYDGSGLGLVISKKFVELMGGEITVESIEGKGSTFSSEIPLVKSEGWRPVTEKIQNYSVDQFKDLKVLLIEDNLANLQLGIALLGTLGCQFKAVERASDALSLMAKENFELLLIDIQMPGISGLEMIKVIREKEKTTKNHQLAIAVTANALKTDEEIYLQSGFDGYVSKPIMMDALVEVMNRVLNHSKRRCKSI